MNGADDSPPPTCLPAQSEAGRRTNGEKRKKGEEEGKDDAGDPA